MSKNRTKGYFRYDQEEQQQYSQSQEQDKQIQRSLHSVIPRFIKNKIQKIDASEIVINLSKTHYEIIEYVSVELGWRIQQSKKSQIWDIMWVDCMIQAHDLFKLHPHQKISHFPSISVISRKDLLGRGLEKMIKYFPQNYNFFPRTWSIPSEYTDLLLYHQSKIKEQKKQYYIYKPEASCQGKGIYLTDKVDQLISKSGVVQIYINDPFLIQGLKFDLRIYVLLTSVDPLRIFIYQEGLVRFATQFYVKAKKKNIKEKCIHLTNYAINKLNNKFIFNQNTQNMHKGHKRSLSSVYIYLQKKGVNITKIKEQIDDIIVKTLITGQPMLAHIYGLSQPDNFANDMCFQILGFDILITENQKPILLEVNHTPSFVCDTPLDKEIKKNLIKDTLKLLNVNIQTKIKKLNQKYQFLQLRSQRKMVHFTIQQKKKLKIQIQSQKDEYQTLNLGKFRKLHPQHQRYQQMLKYSKQIFDQHYGFKKKGKSLKISSQRENSLERSSEHIQKKKVSKKNSFGFSLQKNKYIQQNSHQLPKINIQNNIQQINKTSPKKQKYVCPIISQAQKHTFIKYRSKQQLKNKIKIIQKDDLNNQIMNRGSFLKPKTLQLDQSKTSKVRVLGIEEKLVEKFSASVKLPLRKEIQSNSLMNNLIFKKLDQI